MIFNLRVLIFAILILGLFQRVSSAQEVDSLEMQQLFQLSLDDLMRIDIVSASGQNQKINNAPSVVSVVTEDQIKNGGYRNVAEALSRVAGIDIITDHFQPNIGIRGINGGMRSWSRLFKVMIDGQSVSFRSSYDNFLDESLIPLEIIERIEIIRGPNSAIYGQNAFLGVVNIITKSGSNLAESSVTQKIGRIDENSYLGLSTCFGGTNNNFDFIFSGSYSNMELQGLMPKNIPGQNIYNANDETKENGSSPISVYTKIKYKHLKWGEFILDGSFQEIDNYTEFQDWGVLTHNNRINIRKGYYRLSWSKLLFNNFETQISASQSTGEPTAQERLDSDNNLEDWIIRKVGYNAYDISAKSTYNFDNWNNVSVGVDYNSEIHDHQRFYSVNNQGTEVLNPGGSEGRSNFENIGVYMQMVLNPGEFFNINFLKGLHLTAGYRFDYHNIYENVFNYRLAGVYQINENFSTKLMYGTSFNAPSSVQLYTNSIYPGDIIGNPDLQPEKAKTLELAFMGGLKSKLFFNFSFYYNEIEDKIEYLLPYGDISNITAANISKIYSAGLETEINYNLKNSKTYINYSYQRTLNERENPLLGNIKVETNLYPGHMVKFGENFSIPNWKIKLNLEGVYIGSRKASEQNSFVYDPIDYPINPYSLDSYFKVNFMISSMDLHIINNTETILSLKIDNVFNTKYSYPGYKDFDIPGLGRLYTFKLSQTF